MRSALGQPPGRDTARGTARDGEGAGRAISRRRMQIRRDADRRQRSATTARTGGPIAEHAAEQILTCAKTASTGVDAPLG
jgi:hypothetical protein